MNKKLTILMFIIIMCSTCVVLIHFFIKNKEKTDNIDVNPTSTETATEEQENEEIYEITDRPSHDKEYSIGDPLDGGIVDDFDSLNEPLVKYPVNTDFNSIKEDLQEYLNLFVKDWVIADHEVSDIQETDHGFKYMLKLSNFTGNICIENCYGAWAFEMDPNTNFNGLYYEGFDLTEEQLKNIESQCSDIQGVLVVESIKKDTVLAYEAMNKEAVYGFKLE